MLLYVWWYDIIYISSWRPMFYVFLRTLLVSLLKKKHPTKDGRRSNVWSSFSQARLNSFNSVSSGNIKQWILASWTWPICSWVSELDSGDFSQSDVQVYHSWWGVTPKLKMWRFQEPLQPEPPGAAPSTCCQSCKHRSCGSCDVAGAHVLPLLTQEEKTGISSSSWEIPNMLGL